MSRVLMAVIVSVMATLALSGCVVYDDHPRGGYYRPYYGPHYHYR